MRRAPGCPGAAALSPSRARASPRRLGAGGDPTASGPKPGFTVPAQAITTKDKHLGDPYITEMLQKKGLTESQIASIRTGMRRYADSFLKDGRIELDSGGYRVLTNMLIHLVEESSRAERP